MTTGVFVKAITSLMTELCDGPPNPRETWIVSNAAGSGMLGTVASLSPGQAGWKPASGGHSIAEHVAHVRFSLDLVVRRAHGSVGSVDWERSFDAGALDDKTWPALQLGLRDSYTKVVALPVDDQALGTPQMVQGYIATVGHVAYHLGAIRTLARLVS